MSRRYESNPTDPAPLGQPLHFAFANRSAPNRFLKGAMSELLATWSPTDPTKRGIPTKELINLYRHWGEGGTGVLLTGNVMVAYDHLEAAGNTIIPPDAAFEGERFERFAELAKAAKQHGSLILAQVGHAGRQVEERIQKNPVSASDVQLTKEFFGKTFAKPHPATKDEIKAIVDAFAHAAEYLDKAGFDGLELHGAHGYLLAQFLSGTTNRRTDEYGGSLTNRARIVVEIAQAIRERVSPSFILGIKLNSAEFQDNGFQPEEAREVVKILEASRFDFVELSGGTYEELGLLHRKESTKKRESFFLEFAEMITPALKETKSYVTGGFLTVGAMVDALKTVDGVGLGRSLCQEPRLVNDVLSGKVTGTIKPAHSEGDLVMSVVSGGTQIRMIGKDLEPFDGSDEKVVATFVEDIGRWTQELAADVDMQLTGYVDKLSFATVPYRSATLSETI